MSATFISQEALELDRAVCLLKNITSSYTQRCLYTCSCYSLIPPYFYQQQRSHSIPPCLTCNPPPWAPILTCEGKHKLTNT